MPRVETPSHELVIRAGRLTEGTAFLSIDPVDDLGTANTQRVYLLLEPVDDSPLAGNVADEIIQRLRRGIAEAGSQSATSLLLTAIEDVNHWLVQANAIRTPDRRVTFGFTCVLARGDDVYVAQSAPSQVLIVQEGELYAFPELDSWHWDRDANLDDSSSPLGARETTQPDLYYTKIDTGDVIVLCSTSIARVLQRGPQDVFLRGEADEILGYIDEMAQMYSIEDAHAAAIVVPYHRQRRSRERPDLTKRLTSWCYHLLPEETAERLRRRRNLAEKVDLQSQDVQNFEYSADAPATESISTTQTWNEPDDPVATSPRRGRRAGTVAGPSSEITSDVSMGDNDYWHPETGAQDQDHDEVPRKGGRTLTDLLAGVILAFSAAVVGVWQLTVNRDRPIDGPRDDGTLGLPRLNRYDDSMHMPDFTSISRRLPRTPFNRLTAIVALVLVALLTGALVISIRNSHQRAHAAKVEAAFNTVVTQRQQGEQAKDPNVAHAYLLAAQQSLKEAVDVGLDPIRAAQQQQAISTDMDQTLKIDRLSNVQVLGGVPAAPAGVTPRIFFGNGQLYVFTDALYRLDSNGGTLVRLIGSGDNVGDSTTGTLEGAAWGDGAPIVFDGSAAYVFDPTSASWSKQPVGTFGSPHTGIVATNGYAGNLYLLKPDTAQILKFTAGSFSSAPEDWTSGIDTSDLGSAVDMAIDGHIYVLLKDGRLLDLYRSSVDSTVTPTVTPAISDAVALSEQPDRPYYYVADSQGRIIRLDRNGQMVQQFEPKDGEPSLNGIKDMAVDDGTSSAYILTNSTLLTVRLPGPPSASK
jgi:hypothetical protein